MTKYKLKRTWDFTTVSELDRKLFPDDDRLKFSPDSAYWLLWHNKKPVGFCVLSPVEGKINQDTCYLSRSGILKDHQGKGLQRRMIQTRLRYAKEHGFDAVLTYTVVWNTPSLVNLLKCGFKTFEPAYRWAGTAIYFVKTFKESK